MNRKLHIKLAGIILLLISSLGIVNAQEHTIHTGEWFRVKSGTEVYIIGNLTDTANITPSLNQPITNQGAIYIGGDLYNKGDKNVFGNINQSSGSVIFNGNSGRNIYGRDSIYFHNLVVDLGSVNGLTTNAYLVVNDSLYLMNGRLILEDSVTLYHSTAGSDANSGVINENNIDRIHGPNPLRLENYPWNASNTYTLQQLKNIGISYKVNDYLGAGIPIIRRENVSQECGPSESSVERTFTFQNITTTGEVQNVTIEYHNPNELGNNLTGDLMHIYRSNNEGDSWEDIGGTCADSIVNNSPLVHNISVYSMYTVSKDTCDVLPNIQIAQIITATTPHDTLFNLTNAMACDPINPDAQLLPVGDPGIYTWTYPDNSKVTGIEGVSITPGILGQFILSVQDIRGCVNHDTINVIQAPAADASFSVNAAGYCENSMATFTPGTSNTAGYTYAWDFGDGNTTTGYNVANTYLADGTYQVNLTVTTDQGCIDGEVNNLVIHPIPTASFSSISACPGSPLTLENNSLANPTQPVSLAWDILSDNTTDLTSSGMGDGSGGNTTYTFATEGTYSVTLTATSNGCPSVPYIGNVVVYPNPVAAFTYSNACEGQSVAFTNGSYISDASFLNHSWNINGSNYVLTNPTYTYTTDGTYPVTLTTTSNHGCVNSITQNVTIDDNPAVNFMTANVCVNNLASFGGTSTIAPSTWAWNFGDGNNGSGQNATNTYSTSGTFNVTLTATTSQGCVGTASKNIVIYPGPTVSYSALDACAGVSVPFQNTTTNAVSYSWNFPTLGVTSTTTHENRTFNTAGYHAATLTATSSNGCSSSYTDSVNIFPLPIVNLGGPSIATCGTSYVLDATPSNTTGNTYFWGTGATTAQFNATYNSNFSVTVTSGNGCVSSDNATVTLNSAVVPNLGSNRTVCDQEVLNAGYSGATYLWNTGATSQSIIVTTTGTYSVDITDQNGCVGSNSVVINVTTSDPVNLGANLQTACQGETITLNAGNPGNSFLWSNGATSQSINVTTDGYYSVVVTNAAGCQSGDTVGTQFFAAPLVDLGPDGAYCVENSYNVFTSGSINYLWNTGSNQPDLTVLTSGTYWVDVTNLTTNCTTRDSVDVVINALPIVNLGNDTILCSYQDITLDAGNPGSSYLWNNGALSQTTTVFATGSYAVNVTDANGCENDDQIYITLNDPFEFDLGPDRPFCNGSTIVLNPNVTSASNFNWYTSVGQVATSSTYSVPDTGKYYVTITDIYGCVASDSITIIPSTLSLSAVYLADSKVLIGDTIQFINLSYPKPYDSYWDFGNGAFTTDSMPTYTYFIPGDYDVKLTVDNGNCVSELTKTITVDPIKIYELESKTPPSLYTSIIDMLIYPNPNNGEFSLKLKLEAEAAVELEFFNMIGQRIYKEKFQTEETIRTYDFSGVEPGMYLVRARVGKEARTIKFIKI